MSNIEPPSIVIVESQPLMLTMLGIIFAAAGMNVLEEVADSSQAIQIVSRIKPRIILFAVGNVSLPDLERISALRHDFPNMLILALVSGEFRGQERMALDYGAHCALSKSVTREELLATLKELLKEFER